MRAVQPPARSHSPSLPTSLVHHPPSLPLRDGPRRTVTPRPPLNSPSSHRHDRTGRRLQLGQGRAGGTRPTTGLRRRAKGREPPGARDPLHSSSPRRLPPLQPPYYRRNIGRSNNFIPHTTFAATPTARGKASRAATSRGDEGPPLPILRLPAPRHPHRTSSDNPPIKDGVTLIWCGYTPAIGRPQLPSRPLHRPPCRHARSTISTLPGFHLCDGLRPTPRAANNICIGMRPPTRCPSQHMLPTPRRCG